MAWYDRDEDDDDEEADGDDDGSCYGWRAQREFEIMLGRLFLPCSFFILSFPFHRNVMANVMSMAPDDPDPTADGSNVSQ